MATAEARVSRVRIRTLDTTPRPRRYRWRMPLWMQALSGLAALGAAWAAYVGLWAVVSR